MDVGWGSALAETSGGLDIVGVRALDQSIEASLVVGITTISSGSLPFDTSMGGRRIFCRGR